MTSTSCRHLLFALFIFTSSLYANVEIHPGKAVLRWNNECDRANLNSLLDQLEADITDSVAYWPRYYIQFADSILVDSVVNELQQSECVVWAEPQFIVELSSGDEFYEDQWYLQNQLPSWVHQPEPTEYADMDVDYAWTIQNSGHRSVRVAVFDTGIPYDTATHVFLHPDLQNDLDEVNYPFELWSPAIGEINDGNGHGTEVIGILAANTNNEIGIAGIANRSTIMVFRNEEPELARIMDFPEEIRPQIVSLSWQHDSSDALEDDIAAAQALNILVVVSGGNRRAIPITDLAYPAQYALEYDNVVAVGGTMSNDHFWYSSSSSGALSGSALTVSAPALNIFTTKIGTPSYGVTDIPGTSFAAPAVAAIAALVIAQANESNVVLEPDSIRRILAASSDDCNYGGENADFFGENGDWMDPRPGHDDFLGYGRVNAFKALLRTPGNKELEDDLVIEPHHYDHDSSGNDISPYFLVDQLTVPEGLVLTLNPGTRIKFDAGASLDIAGKFWAKGTAEEPIIFEFPSNTGGGGIYIVNADSVELAHCIFKRAPIVYVQGGASTLITQCVFDSCYIGLELMDAPTATTDVTENLFSHCRHGLWGSFSAGTIADNVFDACGRVGIYWQGDRANGERAFISGNEVRSCGYTLPYWGGGYFSGTTAILECNLFEHNYRYQVNCLNNANIVMNSLYSGRGNNDLIDTVAVTWCVTRRHVRHMPRSV